MKCSGENVILRGIVHAVSGFPLHFMFYRGNLDCFSNRVVLDFKFLVLPIYYTNIGFFAYHKRNRTIVIVLNKNKLYSNVGKDDIH